LLQIALSSPDATGLASVLFQLTMETSLIVGMAFLLQRRSTYGLES
jgi:hypothetical protein